MGEISRSFVALAADSADMAMMKTQDIITKSGRLLLELAQAKARPTTEGRRVWLCQCLEKMRELEAEVAGARSAVLVAVELLENAEGDAWEKRMASLGQRSVGGCADAE